MRRPQSFPFPHAVNPNDRLTVLRRIRLNKSDLHNDFDAWNAKLAGGPAMSGVDVYAKDGVESDATESEDGLVISRLFDYRDAELRDELQSVLVPDMGVEACDFADSAPEYVYDFMLDARWHGQLHSVATKMHEYLVKGALVDWYSSLGIGYGAELKPRLKELLNDITNSLLPFSDTIHMQPFGPAYRFR